jgi:pimeloyl-ACP methyl ester carboxylesterase/class 3 adenylate cyclase
MESSETRYAKTPDGVHIAYQTLGNGPRDIVFMLGWATHLELQWDHPDVARFYRRLSEFSRLILFDRRGTGLSDRGVPVTFEDGLDDMQAVLDAAGSSSAALIGCDLAGRHALLMAATHPDRVSAVVTVNSHPASFSDDDYPWGSSRDEHARLLRGVRELPGLGSDQLQEMFWRIAPSVARDEKASTWWRRTIRSTVTQNEMAAILETFADADVRHILEAVKVPCLIIHILGDGFTKIDASRYMAARLPNATLVELPGMDHLPFFENRDAVIGAIEEFLTGVRPAGEANRALATVLFTDIVSSTERAAAVGDAAWTRLLNEHDSLVMRQLGRYRGQKVNPTGDGVLATFDGPARAVLCAKGIIEAVRPLGIDVRAGLHTGEVELRGADIGGIAVHIGQRVSALAGPGEVLVSRTVTDLVAGSGLEFEERGEHELKGVPGKWAIYAVRG